MSTKKSSTAAGGNDSLSTAFGAAQSMQELQQQAVGRVIQKQLQAVSQLSTIKGPMDLVALQVDLMAFGMQEAMQFWTQLAGAATQQQQDAAGGDASTAGAAASSTNSLFPANPMFQAWQNMLNTSLNGSAPPSR
jgi:hypothetical protein